MFAHNGSSYSKGAGEGMRTVHSQTEPNICKGTGYDFYQFSLAKNKVYVCLFVCLFLSDLTEASLHELT